MKRIFEILHILILPAAMIFGNMRDVDNILKTVFEGDTK